MSKIDIVFDKQYRIFCLTDSGDCNQSINVDIDDLWDIIKVCLQLLNDWR